MPIHDFIQVSPIYSDEEISEICGNFYQDRHRSKVSYDRVLSIHDDFIQKHYWWIDNNNFSRPTAIKLRPNEMKFFSKFVTINPCFPLRTVGLVYFGISVINDESLQSILLIDIAPYKKCKKMLEFVEFCREAYEKHLWVLHFGI